jgi:hypothetical protein
MIISDVGYHNPKMMIVWGSVDGHECPIITHMASFQIALRVMIAEPDMPRRQVGFIAPSDRKPSR